MDNAVMEMEMDAVAIWRSWCGNAPVVLDYDVLDSIPNANREKSASYHREITGVIPNKSMRLEWWKWAQSRTLDGKETAQFIIPSKNAYEAQCKAFDAARIRIEENRKNKPTGNEIPVVAKSSLKAMLGTSDDVTWGLQTVTITYSDCKSRYTGKISVEGYRNETGRWVHYYRVQCGNRKPVEFTENEIVFKRHSPNTGRWTIQLAHKDR